MCYVGTNKEKEGVTHSVESQCLIHGVIMCGTTWVVPPVLKQLQLLVPHGLVVGASRVEGVHFTRVASILPHEHEALATLVRKLLRRCVVVERIKQRLARAALCGVSGRSAQRAQRRHRAAHLHDGVAVLGLAANNLRREVLHTHELHDGLDQLASPCTHSRWHCVQLAGVSSHLPTRHSSTQRTRADDNLAIVLLTNEIMVQLPVVRVDVDHVLLGVAERVLRSHRRL